MDFFDWTQAKSEEDVAASFALAGYTVRPAEWEDQLLVSIRFCDGKEFLRQARGALRLASEAGWVMGLWDIQRIWQAGRWGYEGTLLVEGHGADEEDEEDPEIIDSPLSRTVAQGTVAQGFLAAEICIFRGALEEGWLLELSSSELGSLVWPQRFETDQAAFDEAMRAIETQGLRALLIPDA